MPLCVTVAYVLIILKLRFIDSEAKYYGEMAIILLIEKKCGFDMTGERRIRSTRNQILKIKKLYRDVMSSWQMLKCVSELTSLLI